MGKMKEKGGYVYFVHRLESDVYITYGVCGPDRSVAHFSTLAEAKKYCIGYYQSDIRDAQIGIMDIKTTTKKQLVAEYMQELKKRTFPTQENYEE